MSLPYQCPIVYENSSGDVSASGFYRTGLTQKLANMLPYWMHMRQNPRSIGQQFFSEPAYQMNKIEISLNDSMRNKFLGTANIGEIDVLYRIPIPSNVNLTDASASGVRCITAPSGCSPSGISQIWVKEVSSLKEFYYDVLPTRVEVNSSGVYASSVDDVVWNLKPSGVYDNEEKYVDVWKKEHDISWCYADNAFRKQDVETMEDYEVYSLNGSGIPLDMCYDEGRLWWVGFSSPSKYYLNLTSTKTQVPQKSTLDTLATYDITNAFTLEPSGILMDNAGILWICDTNKTRTFRVEPKYDYFIMDKNNRYIYMREDYRDSGVFVSNT